MAIQPYLNIETSEDLQVFEFESKGKQVLKKRVHLDLIESTEQLYNLSLGTLSDDGKIDWETESRNGDMESVLQTVAYIGLLYTDKYPERKLFFTGSSPARTRKYQMGITSEIEQINRLFLIEGVMLTTGLTITHREPFEKNKRYDALIFTRKN